MEYVMKNVTVVTGDAVHTGDVVVRHGRVVSMGGSVCADNARVFDFQNKAAVTFFVIVTFFVFGSNEHPSPLHPLITSSASIVNVYRKLRLPVPVQR